MNFYLDMIVLYPVVRVAVKALVIAGLCGVSPVLPATVVAWGALATAVVL